MMKAVLFDFDSTLVDYRYGDALAIERVRALAGIREDEEAFYQHSKVIIRRLYADPSAMKGDVLEARMAQLVGGYGVRYDGSYLEEYLKIYLNVVRSYEGVTRFLDYISPKAKVGLLTNSIDSDYQRKRISASGLEPYFDAIGIANEIGYWKPSREAFVAIAGMLGVEPRDCVFIGDSEELDVAGAMNAGMRSIKRHRDEDAATRADFAFSDYDELMGKIDGYL